MGLRGSPLSPAQRSGRLVDDYLERRRVEAVAGVALLRAVRDGDEQVHIRAEVEVVAGAGVRLLDLVPPVLVRDDLHERAKRAGDVLLRDAQRGGGAGQVLAAVAAALHAVAPEVRALVAAAARGVVDTDRVADDGEHLLSPPRGKVW